MSTASHEGPDAWPWMASRTLGGMPDAILDYADTAETNAMRDDMRRVNAWLERASITFVDDGVEPVDVHDRTPRRLFVILEGDPLGQRFDLSGRLFGGFWQPPLFPCSHSARSPRASCSNVD